MPRFSERSERQLATCDERLQRIARKAIEIIDFMVVEGHRDEMAQNMAYAQGKSQVKFPNGKHNSHPSRAMDIAPFPIDFSNEHRALERFVYLQGIVRAIAESHGIKIRQGIDWDRDDDMRDEKFRDYPHVELIEP